MGNCRWDTTMGKDELKERELEQELEVLYKKVASFDSLENIERQEKDSKEPAKTEEQLKHQKQSGESLSQEREKRTFRLFRIIPVLGLITLSCIIVAILVWPKIYRYEAVNSGGKNYLMRINSLTGGAMYFDGREWLHPPIPAGSAKKFSESPKDQPAPKNTKNWNYAVQVKAYPVASKSEAIAFVEYLKKGQPDVHIEKVHLPERGIWYRILLGYFTSAEEASDYMKEKRIVDAYPDSYVQSRSE